MRRLEDKGEGTLKFLEHGLDELSEAGALVGLGVVNVLGQDCDGFGIRLTLELVSTLLEDETERRRVRHNTVVNDGELGVGVGAERVAVHNGRRTVSGPTGVRDRDLRDEGLRGVDARFGDALAKTSDLSDLLEEEHLSRLVAVDADTGGIISTVFLARETIAENLTNCLPVLYKRLLVSGVRFGGSLMRNVAREIRPRLHWLLMLTACVQGRPRRMHMVTCPVCLDMTRSMA